MSWRDRLLNASVNDVQFFVDNTSTTAQRRINTIKLTGGQALYQDLGRDEQTWDVEGFVTGSDYDLNLAKLIDALTGDEEVKKLVLPHLQGARNVRIIKGPTVTESRGKLGYAVIRFTAAEDLNARKQSLSAKDYAKSPTAAALKLKTVSISEYNENYEIPTHTKYIAKASNAIGLVSGSLAKAQRLIATITNPIEDFNAAINQIKDQADSLARTPNVLSALLATTTESVVRLAISSTTNTTDAPADLAQATSPRKLTSLNAALKNSVFGQGDNEPDPADATAPADAASRLNVRQINKLNRMLALSAYTDVLVTMQLDSSTLALTTLEMIRDEIDALQNISATDAEYQALSDLRASLVDYLINTASKLPAVAQKNQALPVPALLLAHQLYGDAKRESELVSRNNFKRPLEVSGSYQALKK